MTDPIAADASPVVGLHHVTAIAADAARNLRFYTEAFGQRLVKKTVNFDSPGTYHFYFADGAGTPGTVMTFFPFPGARPGRPGAGQAVQTHYVVPPGALPFWRERLPAHGARFIAEETRFGENRAVFTDPDGLILTLVERADDPRAPWTAEGIPADKAQRGFGGVTLALREAGPELDLLTSAFGYAQSGEEPLGAGRLIRLERAGVAAGALEIHLDPALGPASEGAGSVHHIAFRVADRAAQAQVRDAMIARGLQVTERIDRQYFWAVYCRMPNGVLFEVATDEPGFSTDEEAAHLGEALRLPPQYEAYRDRIEAALPPLD